MSEAPLYDFTMSRTLAPYMATSPIRNSAPLRSYVRTKPRALRWSGQTSPRYLGSFVVPRGGGLSLMSEVPLYAEGADLSRQRMEHVLGVLQPVPSTVPECFYVRRSYQKPTCFLSTFISHTELGTETERS